MCVYADGLLMEVTQLNDHWRAGGNHQHRTVQSKQFLPRTSCMPHKDKSRDIVNTEYTDLRYVQSNDYIIEEIHCIVDVSIFLPIEVTVMNQVEHTDRE
jgi:hypothetical protein